MLFSSFPYTMADLAENTKKGYVSRLEVDGAIPLLPLYAFMSEAILGFAFYCYQ